MFGFSEPRSGYAKSFRAAWTSKQHMHDIRVIRINIAATIPCARVCVKVRGLPAPERRAEPRVVARSPGVVVCAVAFAVRFVPNRSGLDRLVGGRVDDDLLRTPRREIVLARDDVVRVVRVVATDPQIDPHPRAARTVVL